MGNKVELSSNHIGKLQRARESKKETEKDPNIKWTLDEDSYILIAASRLLIKELMEQERRKTNRNEISLQCLLNWEIDKKICCEDRKQFNKFQGKKRTEFNQNNDNLIWLSGQDIDFLLENLIILAQSISFHSLRLCTDPNYKKQQKCKRWDQDAVRAYCAVLEVILDEDSSNLYKTLISFNYDHVAQYIENIKYTPRRGIIYIPHVSSDSSRYYQTWLLRRLEQLLKEKSLPTVNKIIYDLTAQNTDLNSSDVLEKTLRDKLKKDVHESLKVENILLVFKNIDCFDKRLLKDIVIKFWQNLTENMVESNGFLLMVWLDRGKRNDWRNQLSDFSMVHSLPIVSNFAKEDFQEILDRLDDKFWQLRLKENKDHEINQLWEQSQQGQIDKTLEAFYRRFKCKLASETRWQNYP